MKWVLVLVAEMIWLSLHLVWVEVAGGGGSKESLRQSLMWSYMQSYSQPGLR